jgi:allantoinase
MDHKRFDNSPIIKRPKLKWPNDAKLAVWIAPNIEYHKFLGPGVGINQVPFFPDVLNFGWRDYGLRVGIWRFMEMMDKYGLRATVALNAMVCEAHPEIIEEGCRRNWEWMGHGLTNSQVLAGLPEAEERAVIRETVEIITKATGKAPRGWLGPGLAETVNTPDILAENGIEYLCDFNNDDQPYPIHVKSGRLIEVPYSIEINDIPFFVGKGMTGDDFRQAIQDQFDVLYAEGAKTGKVMAIALHPFLTSVPHRHKYLDQALGYITKHKDIWLTTGGEIANWYYEHYYKK